MTTIAYHPGLESHVIENARPFPEITEQLGIPIQTELAEAVQPVLADFYERFEPDAEDSVPLIVTFGPEGEGFGAMIQTPDEMQARADYLDRESGVYRDLRIVALGSYIDPVLEDATFGYTDRKMTVRGPNEAYDTPRYQFSICSGVHLDIRLRGAETAEGREQMRADLAERFGALTVGKELAAMDLSALQKEHLHWLGVILKGKYLQERLPGSEAWYSRAPEPSQLAQYKEELILGIPDSQSDELVPTVFSLVRRVAELRQPVTHRIGENYTLTDRRGNVLAGQAA
jgi:hypothetical protein